MSDQRNIWAYTNDATEDNTEGFRYQYVINHNLKWEGNSSDETLFANKHKPEIRLDLYLVSPTLAPNSIHRLPTTIPTKTATPSAPVGELAPVSPAMVNEWKDWAAKQTYTDGYQGGSPSDRFHMVVQSTRPEYCRQCADGLHHGRG